MRLTPRARQTRAPQERSAPAPNICIEPEDDQTVTRSAGGKKLRAAFAAFWSAAQRPWESVARPPGLRRGRGRIHRARRKLCLDTKDSGRYFGGEQTERTAFSMQTL